MIERLYINLYKKTLVNIIVLIFFIIPHSIHSWDLAINSETEINLLNSKGVLDSLDLPIQFTDLYSLALDPVNQRLLFSDNSRNFSIYSYIMKNKTLEPLVLRQQHEVHGIAYDPITMLLLWTDGNGKTIWRRSLGEPSEPQPLLVFQHELPMGIVVDSCKRFIFWANSNHLNASIDRASMDGSKHVKIITTDIFLPIGITTDEPEEKIYWTDDKNGIYYRIERSNYDGSKREIVTERTNQEPFSIAVSGNYIYWTDLQQNALWKIDKSTKYDKYNYIGPEIVYKRKLQKSYGLVSYNDRVDCNRVVTTTNIKPVEVLAKDEPATTCLFGKSDGRSCVCQPGHKGRHCEVSVCYNYCLYGGVCEIDKYNYPVCNCLPGYVGSRCEFDICYDYCLNGGRCTLQNNEPVCTCGNGYAGQRCQVKNCDCSSPTRDSDCDCATISYYETNNSTNSLAYSSEDCLYGKEVRDAAIISLLCLTLLLTAAVIVLTRKVCVLKRRPRIKKRIIVNKNIRGQTPLTSMPTNTQQTEQCEITIENCCNMNICETPCFEPNLRSTKSSSKKTEDCRGLLKNMEAGDTASVDS